MTQGGPPRAPAFTLTSPRGFSMTDSPSAGRRILVVDDSSDARTSLRILLELWGHDVREAADGRAALEVARAFRPQVVLLDLGMPLLDGYQVARRLRQTPGLEGTLLIAATAYSQPLDVVSTRAAAFDHHLGTPSDLDLSQRLIDGLTAGRPA